MNPNDKRRAVETREDWERVLSAAAHDQQIIPDAVLVGSSAAAMHADHRFSYDDDHVVNLKDRYDRVLSLLENQAGWTTNRLNPPVMILGDLHGVDTGIRNLIRSEPLETTTYEVAAGTITLPTLREMARIKGFLIVRRNTTRDFIDFVALADKIERAEDGSAITKALHSLNRLYPQANGSSVILQLAKQLSEPHPRDFGDGDLTIYRMIGPQWREWTNVKTAAQRFGVMLLRDFNTETAPQREGEDGQSAGDALVRPS
jgi:hypothetical protein